MDKCRLSTQELKAFKLRLMRGESDDCDMALTCQIINDLIELRQVLKLEYRDPDQFHIRFLQYLHVISSGVNFESWSRYHIESSSLPHKVNNAAFTPCSFLAFSSPVLLFILLVYCIPVYLFHRLLEADLKYFSFRFSMRSFSQSPSRWTTAYPAFELPLCQTQTSRPARMKTPSTVIARTLY